MHCNCKNSEQNFIYNTNPCKIRQNKKLGDEKISGKIPLDFSYHGKKLGDKK